MHLMPPGPSAGYLGTVQCAQRPAGAPLSLNLVDFILHPPPVHQGPLRPFLQPKGTVPSSPSLPEHLDPVSRCARLTSGRVHATQTKPQQPSIPSAAGLSSLLTRYTTSLLLSNQTPDLASAPNGLRELVRNGNADIACFVGRWHNTRVELVSFSLFTPFLPLVAMFRASLCPGLCSTY